MFINIKKSIIMTASFNISVLNSHIQSAAQNGNRKGFRSSNRNMYTVEVVDFEGEATTFELEAASCSEAAEKAEAASIGLMVNYMNIYSNK